MHIFEIGNQPLTFEILGEILSQKTHLKLSDESLLKIATCRSYLDSKLESVDTPVYGITTGFGALCNKSIPADDLSQLQYNLVVSHACGTGDIVSNEIVAIMLLLKVAGMAKGHSGVQIETVQRLIDLFNKGIYPVVRELGSLGASGDLAPLAHLVLPLLNLGEVNYGGKVFYSHEINSLFKLEPIKLKSKEGLALLNGTQFMSAHGVYVAMKARDLMVLSDIIAAMAVEAYNGRIDPFSPELHTIRPHKGQILTSAAISEYLKGSSLINSDNKAVQDPYSFRCTPQVHGAAKDTLAYFEKVILTEINSVTDNPTIFPDQDKILSGGNFHGEPLAFALDFISIALAEVGNIAERRVYRLISGQRGLPEFLVANPGLNSGFMIPQYAAASIVSQNKQLCTPSSVDSITSSNEQEDHVSMGANAATKAVRVLHNLERILAIEFMVAAQALEFRGADKTSPFLYDFFKSYREIVPFVENDVLMYPMIDQTITFIRNFAKPNPNN